MQGQTGKCIRFPVNIKIGASVGYPKAAALDVRGQLSKDVISFKESSEHVTLCAL
jgi:hypothetical protein